MAKRFVWGVADKDGMSSFPGTSKAMLQKLMPRMGFARDAKIVRVLEVRASKRT